jgi:hypothetical protein
MSVKHVALVVFAFAMTTGVYIFQQAILANTW